MPMDLPERNAMVPDPTLRESIDALIDELEGLANDAAGSGGRHKRAEPAPSRAKRQAGVIMLIITILKRIGEWLTDITRLTVANIPEIQEMIVEVKALRVQVVQQQVVLTSSQISEVRKTTKLGITLRGEIVQQEAAAAKEAKLQETKTAVTQIQTSITTISSQLTNIASETGGDGAGNAERIAALAAIKEIMASFTASGVVAMTMEKAEQLSELQATLESVKGDFSAAEIAEASATLAAVAEAETAVNAASEAIVAKEAVQKEIGLLEQLLTATTVIEQSVTELFAAMASVTSTEIIETTAITETITLIQNLQVQAFTEEEVSAIKSFETKAVELIVQLQAGTGVLVGLDTLQTAVSELSLIASAALEEMTSNQAINENFEILSNVETLVEMIIEKVEILKESTTGTDTAGEETILLIIEFLKSFNAESVTVETETQLTEFVTSMTSLVEEGTGAFSSLDELLSESNKVKESVSTALAQTKEDVQALETLEEMKTMAELTADISTQLTELTKKVNSESSVSSDSVLEGIIQKIIIAMQKILSGSTEITTEELQTLQEEISSKVSTIEEISVVAGLEKSVIIASIAVKLTESAVMNLEMTFDETRSLVTLEKALQILEDIKTFVSTTLVQDEGGKNSAVIEQLQAELSKWQKVKLIKENSIQTVLGFFETVKGLSTEDRYAGLTQLTETVDSVQETIIQEKTATEVAIKELAEATTIESAQTLIAESKTTLLQLQEKTLGFTEEVASEEVNNCIDMFNQVISDGVSEDIVKNLGTALEELNNFVTSYDTTTEVGVQRLQEAIDLAKEAKASIDRVIDQAAAEEDNNVELLEDAQLQVQELQSLLGQLSAGDTEEKNNAIDEVKEFIVQLKENIETVSEETIQMLISMNAKISNIATLKEHTVTITGFTSTLQEVTDEIAELVSVIDEALVEEQRLADQVGVASVIENVKAEVEKIIEIIISIQEFETTGTENTESISGFKTTLEGITDVLLVTTDTVQEIKVIVTELQTIKESNIKPDNIDDLKMAAEDVVEASEESLSVIQSEVANKATIKISKMVEETLADIEMSFSEFIKIFAVEQLIGEDIEELSTIIEIAKTISSNTDSATEEDIALLKETFAAAEEKLNLLSDEQGAGNLVAALTAVEKAKDSTMSRLSELEDLKEIEMEEQSLEKINTLLLEVQTEIESKITAIGEITTTDSNEELAEITELKVIMEDYISKMFEKTDTELQTSLDQLKEITVTAGQEISGLFELQTLTQEAITAVEEEQQFVMMTKESRNEKTILSQASAELMNLELEFASLKTFFEGNQEEQTTLFIVDDIKIILSEMESTEKITFETVKELKKLNSELKEAYTLTNVDTRVFEEVETQISSIAENIEESLQELAVTSEEREAVTTLRTSSTIISEIKSVFESISVDSATVDNADIEGFVTLLTDIKEVGSVNAVQVKELERLEVVFATLGSISEQDVTKKDDALILIEEVSEIISEKLSSTQTAITITAKSSVLNKATDAMRTIIDTTSTLISDIGLASEESPNEDVASLIVAVKEVSVASLTTEQITQIETTIEKLEAITVTEGTGIKDLLMLKSVAESKVEELFNSNAVLGKTKMETVSLNFVTAIETVVRNIKMELTDILDNSDISGSDVSSVITEIADILVEDVDSMTDQNVEELEEKYNTLVLTKTTIKGGADAIKGVVDTLSVLEESVMEKKSKIEKNQKKNFQIAIFMEAESTMTKISEITSSILVIGEETADSEENEDISALIKSLTMFESNVLGITKSVTVRCYKGVVDTLSVFGRKRHGEANQRSKKIRKEFQIAILWKLKAL
ncbi:golgin subfamily B member 1-like [Penaeus indicus]|uniref:golgin subfamily B member 1-like n=1 Tax=Penaeus indicus TaxID=29960 RepID=UPI00300C1680